MPRVCVAIPTLARDDGWRRTLAALDQQTFRDFATVIVDNSGATLVQSSHAQVIHNRVNEGFGAAVNRAWRLIPADYCASLNDDALPEPGWLQALVETLDQHPEAGMAASCVLLDEDHLDSAGMLVAYDGSSKQRGHLQDPELFQEPCEVLCPSGSAALYRSAALAESGGFDDSFFLYCEDTDLGLRLQRLGWRARYVPAARVLHAYSQSAGRASTLKAYLVERNRLRLAARNLPGSWLLRAPFSSAARYLWHTADLFGGDGKAAEFRTAEGAAWKLPWYVLKAHAALLAELPALWKQRTPAGPAYRALLRQHRISARRVASL